MRGCGLPQVKLVRRARPVRMAVEPAIIGVIALASRPIERKTCERGLPNRRSAAGPTSSRSCGMGRLSAIFVAICMVLIAGSIGAVLYLRFALSGVEVAIVAIAALTGLSLFNAVSARVHDRGDFGGQVGDLARGTADLARQMSELNRRGGALHGTTQPAVEKPLAATLPINAEIGEVGGIIKQMAETVAAHDTQLKGLTPRN